MQSSVDKTLHPVEQASITQKVLRAKLINLIWRRCKSLLRCGLEEILAWKLVIRNRAFATFSERFRRPREKHSRAACATASHMLCRPAVESPREGRGKHGWSRFSCRDFQRREIFPLLTGSPYIDWLATALLVRSWNVTKRHHSTPEWIWE